MTMPYRYCPECGRDVLTERRRADSECADCDAPSLKGAHRDVLALCDPDPTEAGQ